MRCRSIVGFVFLAAMVFTLTGCEPDRTSSELRLSHPFTETDPRHKWAEYFAQQMEQRTGGEVKIRIFPNQQLFKAKQQYEGLRTNRIDFAIYPMPWLSGRVPSANIGALPGIVTSPHDGLKWRDLPIWDMLSEDVERADVHLPSNFWVPSTYAAQGSVPRTPENFAGMTMRGMGTPLEVLLVEKGAAISSMPAADTYFGMQTGSLDVLFATVSSFVGYSMHEVISEIVVERSFIAGGHFVLMSRGARRKIADEHHPVLEEVLRESEAYYADLAEAEMRAMAKNFEERGVTLVRLTDDEFASWIDAAKQYSWEYFEESVPRGAELLQALQLEREEPLKKQVPVKNEQQTSPDS